MLRKMIRRIRHGFIPRSGWSETRRADREKMVKRLAELCEEHGVWHRINKPSIWGENSVEIDIVDKRTGLSLSVDFNEQSIQPNVFVLSWHFDCKNDDYIINTEVFHDYNQFHFRKATDVAHGWNSLEALIIKRLKQIADGTATKPRPPEQ